MRREKVKRQKNKNKNHVDGGGVHGSYIALVTRIFLCTTLVVAVLMSLLPPQNRNVCRINSTALNAT